MSATTAVEELSPSAVRSDQHHGRHTAWIFWPSAVGKMAAGVELMALTAIIDEGPLLRGLIWTR